MSVLILDGPMGTLLIERGVNCPEPGWSAHALAHSPDCVCGLHAEYAKAGANIHTANTFRTRPESIGNTWKHLAEKAVDLARQGAGTGSRIAGSIAPIADCYRPDLSPPNPQPNHQIVADHLANAGVDLLLVETFPHIQEALSAVRAAHNTGLPVWVSFTAGPTGDLLDPKGIRNGAEAAIQAGASAVLVNCIPAIDTLRFVRALKGIDVPFGAYANAGESSDGIGWANHPDGPKHYADLAEQWVDAGASMVGGCCGTGPQHIAELSRRFGATCDQTVS